MKMYDTFTEVGHYQQCSAETFDKRDVYYPFIKKVIPNIAEVQEIPDCLTIIYFERERTNLFKNRETGKIVIDKELGAKNERDIIIVGLQPLCSANSLDKKEAESIIVWFQDIKKGREDFHKKIIIDDARYTIRTHQEGSQRSLILSYDHIQP